MRIDDILAGLIGPSVPFHHSTPNLKWTGGRGARWAEHDPRPGLVPPDRSGGHTSIFAAQSGEAPQPAAE